MRALIIDPPAPFLRLVIMLFVSTISCDHCRSTLQGGINTLLTQGTSLSIHVENSYILVSARPVSNLMVALTSCLIGGVTVRQVGRYTVIISHWNHVQMRPTSCLAHNGWRDCSRPSLYQQPPKAEEGASTI